MICFNLFQIKFKKGSNIEIEEDEYFLLTQEKSSESTWLDQKVEKVLPVQQ